MQNKIEPKSDNDNPSSFEPKLVSELQDGTYKFRIPSYQRGYRWSDQEVSDLLDDLCTFVNTVETGVYFLQPLVVRPLNGEWEVLDGQQRLTTMLLVLIVLNRFIKRMPEEDREDIAAKQYTITYDNRPKIDFNKLDPSANIDEYYVYNAKRVIDAWVNEKRKKGLTGSLDKIAQALFSVDNERKICFIWYAVDESSAVRESIGLFNRLNKGKIKLTGAELIKALFVLAYKKHGQDAASRFSLEWDEIVRKLQDDAFWYCLSPVNEGQTRIDTLFEFVAGKASSEESYRLFQKVYDELAHSTNPVKAFDDNEYVDFYRLWPSVTRRFDDLLRWYEDVTAYNYVGWLSHNGLTLNEIKKVWDSAKPEKGYDLLRNEDRYRALRERIKKELRIRSSETGQMELLDRDGLSSLTYRENYDHLKKILLLFNVETSRIAGERFRFDLFSREKGWDLEHVDSQQDNALNRNEDQIAWIGFVLEVLSWMDQTADVKALMKSGEELTKSLQEKGRDVGNGFGVYYTRVVSFLAEDKEVGEVPFKDGIANLALLDCGTNRSYKNAPYPYKRFRIIDRDRRGGFVPECTKALFLKYYSDTGKDTSQIDKFRWSDNDRQKYFDAICHCLNDFIGGGK